MCFPIVFYCDYVFKTINHGGTKGTKEHRKKTILRVSSCNLCLCGEKKIKIQLCLFRNSYLCNGKNYSV